MKQSVWLNAHLYTCATEETDGVLRDGALAVRDGHIAWVGPRTALPEAWRKVETIDANGAWITPGLIDCHTHLVYAGHRADEFAARLEGTSYAAIAAQGGGIMATVRATRATAEAALLAQSGKRLAAFAAEGVTTVEIKSGYGLDTPSEIKMLGLARRLGERFALRVRATFLGAHAVPPEYAGRPDDYLTLVVEEMLPRIAALGLADAVDAYHERLAFDAAQVSRVFAAAQRLGLPVKLHADQLADNHGAALAARFQALSADHLEYTSEAGIAALATAGTVAVLLPGAFYSLREQRAPPLAALRRAGVPMAVASDCNPGTSPTHSLLLMLNMACVLFGLTPREALWGVTRNAARALGLHDQIGSLEVGKVADFALWDISSPNELVYALGANPCLGVVFGGQPRPRPDAGDQCHA
jgi:imidazolonepropionase